MNRKNKKFSELYPRARYLLGGVRGSYLKGKEIVGTLEERQSGSKTIPDAYDVCNTETINSDIELNILEGMLPHDLDGNMYICQCLGTPSAFMVGDTNIVKLGLSQGKAMLKNRLMWTPAAIARLALKRSKHRFEHMGLMFMSPGMGIFSYTEGMYLLPDGRLGVTSDVDRPWIIDRKTLCAKTPLGKRSQWLPMMAGAAGDLMGNLFAGYSNSHVIYNDPNTDELFLVNYRYAQTDSQHPCNLMKWDGKTEPQSWAVKDEVGDFILIKQSLHELVFTRDYIILADTAFVTGTEMVAPWMNAPLPEEKTVVYLVKRADLIAENSEVVAKRVEIDEACIHLIADYENPNGNINIYMLHTPATNTAEIIRSYDVDLQGRKYPEHVVGYGTLPVLDISSIGKHVVNGEEGRVLASSYIRDEKLCWGPYMYTYMGRQTRPFDRQDLFVMFKGFKAEMLPKRVFDAYNKVENRRVPLEDMVAGKLDVNNSIARIDKDHFAVADSYVFPDKVLLYTISCMESSDADGSGYLLAGVVSDVAENKLSSGHEYWIFEADDLSKGPVCKLGHKSLNNSVLFHTVYLTSEQERSLDDKEAVYDVPLEEDYPVEELLKFSPEVKKTFEEIIYPYFGDDTEKRRKAERMLEIHSTRRVDTHAGKEHLIGEEVVVDAPNHAKSMFEEAERMFKTTGWKKESLKNGVLVESKPIKGPLAASGVHVTRASGVINRNADEFFAYITSPKGYAVIDPVSDPDDHKAEPLEVYDWKEGARLEAAVASTDIPMMAPCDFVVLNAIDPSIRMFASKSIIHPALPGASRYSAAPSPENGHERALNTFVIKVLPLRNNRCRVLCINYADMAGKTTSAMNNLINKRYFFQSLFKRMRSV